MLRKITIQNVFNFVCDIKEMAPFSDIRKDIFLYLINKVRTLDGIYCSVCLVELCCPVVICFLTLNLLTTTIVAPPSNASKWQTGFNLAFKGLNYFFSLLFSL